MPTTMQKGSSPTIRFLTLLLTLALSAAGLSCDGDDPTPSAPTPSPAPAPAPAPAPSTTVSLGGFVAATTGERIPGVTITILDGPNAGRTTGTTATGDYQFDGLTRGTGNVSATHVFYNETRAGAAIDGTSALNFTMQRRTVGLTGTVENAAGGVVANATVRVVDGPNAGTSTNTDLSGVYQLTLLAGNTNLVASASGFSSDSRGVVVNGTNTLNFRLTQTTPAVSFTATRTSGGSGSVPQEWQFVATVGGSAASNVRNYDWNFGDGASSSETGATEQHVYRVRGTYTVTLTVNLTSGSTLTATKEISTDTSDPDSLTLRRQP